MTITSQELVTMLIGVIAPLLVGLVTKVSTSSGTKAIILAAISGLVGVGQGFLDNPPGMVWDWQHAAFFALTGWVVAVATYFGLWKPTGVSVAAQNTLIKDPPAELPAAA